MTQRIFHTTLVTVVTVALSALVGCKSNAEKYVEFEEQQADIVQKDLNDCAQMGKDLKAWDDSTKDDRKALEEKMKSMSESDAKAAAEKLKDRISKAKEKRDQWNKCMSDSTVMDFIMKAH